MLLPAKTLTRGVSVDYMHTYVVMMGSTRGIYIMLKTTHETLTLTKKGSISHDERMKGYSGS